MEKLNRYKLIAGIIVFGSIWGMLECVLGTVKLSGIFSHFPVSALLGGLFGLGLMTVSRRIYGLHWMQLGIAIVAGLLRFWAPIGTCVICSALAIAAEGLAFELIFNRPAVDFTKSNITVLKDTKVLALVGIIAGYTIYVTGYMFTQIMTPILADGMFSSSNFIAVLPLIIGRGFFAAIFGGIALPVAVRAPLLSLDVNKISTYNYYAATTGISAFCWMFVFAFFYVI